MKIDEALRAYLLTKAPLTALIGTRILSNDIADGVELPCVVYQKISDAKEQTYSGLSGFEHPVFQYTAYATTKAPAEAIAEQLLLAFKDCHGSVGGMTVQYTEIMNEFSSHGYMPDGKKAYACGPEVKVYYERSN
jgi:hypothetical protein